MGLVRPLRISLLCPLLGPLLLRALRACRIVAPGRSASGSLWAPFPLPGCLLARACRWDCQRSSPPSSSGPFLGTLEPLHNHGPFPRAPIGAGSSCVAAGEGLWSWPAAGLRRCGRALPCITAPCEALWGTEGLGCPAGRRDSNDPPPTSSITLSFFIYTLHVTPEMCRRIWVNILGP